ncbi:MAG: DUF732 domain-containing protein [Mycobacterium pseudokansasii]|nr:DUF732 domain-containing protein [Mycobacterium pseudokansasii]
MISAILLSAAALISATPAAADQTDDEFFGALKKHGIVFANRNAAIAMAHSMCAGLDKGQKPTLLVNRPRFPAHLFTCDRCAPRPGVERSTRPRLPRVGCGPGGASAGWCCTS